MQGNEPVILPIEDELDLHTFNPREIKPLIEDYLNECRKRGILEVRIIHGKGTGQLRRTVHALMEKFDFVISYSIASPERGGHGATMVWLKEWNNT